MNSKQINQNGLNSKELNLNEYIKLTYQDRINRLLSKVNRCIDNNVIEIKKLGFGGLGTVYKVKANKAEESIELAQKVFFIGKDHCRTNDDYAELYTNWQITKYILDNVSSIAQDPFLCECIEKIPLLITTNEQRKILTEANSPEDQYSAAQKASELKDGIFFEIKGNQNLEDIIPSKINEMSFEDKMLIFLDILKGGAILDRVGIIQRDFNCENIQINIDIKPHAYLVDFGKAVHKDIIHLFDDDESMKRDYCGPFFYSAPPEAYDNHEKDENIFGDKYNAFCIGLMMFPIFFSKEGQDLMYNFKWETNDDIVHHRKYLFENIDEVVDTINQRLEKPYNTQQKAMIKSIMGKLINSDASKRFNSENVAREISEEFDKIHETSKENLSYNDNEKCNDNSNNSRISYHHSKVNKILP